MNIVGVSHIVFIMLSAETIAQQYPPQIPQGIYYGQFDRLESINQAMYDRNFVGATTPHIAGGNVPQGGNAGLRPHLESRSVPTKNIRFSAVQEHRTSSVPLVPLERFPAYNPYTRMNASRSMESVVGGFQPPDHNEQVFAPIQSKGPTDYFLANVDAESTLRNQFFALQHGADQAVYVPSSSSDLYRVQVPTHSHPDAQPFPSLFSANQYNTTTNPYMDESRIGKDMFHNCTQTQLRSMDVYPK